MLSIAICEKPWSKSGVGVARTAECGAGGLGEREETRESIGGLGKRG